MIFIVALMDMCNREKCQCIKDIPISWFKKKLVCILEQGIKQYV